LEISMDTGIVKIHGKDYQTVALRIQKFREQYPDWSITSEVLFRDAESVVVKSTIADATGRVLATGLAEEYRAASKINSTSALENAETSAHGRCLAALGLGGTEFASANEVQGAIALQAEKAKAYQDAYLPKMREAALEGLEALKAAYEALPDSPYKADFWKAHGAALKAAAGAVK
jgi:hypothetical protein